MKFLTSRVSVYFLNTKLRVVWPTALVFRLKSMPFSFPCQTGPRFSITFLSKSGESCHKYPVVWFSGRFILNLALFFTSLIFGASFSSFGRLHPASNRRIIENGNRKALFLLIKFITKIRWNRIVFWKTTLRLEATKLSKKEILVLLKAKWWFGNT